MFDLKSFIVRNLVEGVKNSTFTKEYANIAAVNYLAKGMLAEEQVISVNAQVEEWEAAEAAAPEFPTEELTEEPTEELTEEPVEEVIEEPPVESEPVEEVVEEDEEKPL